jgi:hypothetical protein
MNKQFKLTQKLKTDFLNFLETHPPDRFSNNLRSMVLDYLRYELQAGTMPLYLDDFLWSLNDLFDLLDTAAKEFPLPSIIPKPGIINS